MAYTPDVSMFPYFGNHRDIGELEDDLDKQMLENQRLIQKSNASILRRKKIEKENKELKKDLTDYYTMMTECNKCVPEDWDFGFGIQDKECNPELLDDLDHLPYYLNQITEENKKLKEENHRMSSYIESREIKYCDKCRKYGDYDEGYGDFVYNDDTCQYICHECVKDEEEVDLCWMCEKKFCLNDAISCNQKAYNEYLGSDKDDGDICIECIGIIR